MLEIDSDTMPLYSCSGDGDVHNALLSDRSRTRLNGHLALLSRLSNPCFHIKMLGLALLSLLSILYLLCTRKRLHVPPGPRPLPFIGNLHQAPRSNPWLEFEKWHKTYGPILSFKLGQQTFVLLGTHKIAHDLLDRRSAIYSSRPRSIVAGECTTKGFGIIFLPYGAKWRTHHRIQAEFVNPRVSQRYSRLQDVETRQVVRDLLHTSDFSKCFHRFTSSLIFALAYGKRLPRGDEHEIHEIDELMVNLTEKQAPGKWMVDNFPVLNCLPGFLAPWKRAGDEFHQREAKLFEENMAAAQKTRSWNWSKDAKRIKETQQFCSTELAYNIGVLYEAGSDTTAGTLDFFVLACLSFPEAARKAQQELDSVVGPDRLPSFDDLENLPYVNGFVLEVMRWRPLTPLGIPHAVTQDDEYMGYHIPKGSTVLANQWLLSDDEEIFEKPSTFMPERWAMNPELPFIAFGFGRRVCTGRHIAMNSLKITIARVLWAYNVGHAYKNGRKVEVDSFARTPGAVSKPMPFRADFRIRSSKHWVVVQDTWVSTEKDLDVIMEGIGPGRRT